MPNFDVQIRKDYRDMTGLVLDLRSEDLVAEEGSHTGDNGANALTDSAQNWVVNALVGMVVHNITDGSHGTITANTATTVTATLAGGTDNDWDTSDVYSIQGGADSIFRWTNAAPMRRAEFSGVHDGGDNESDLGDSSSPWIGRNLVGMVVYNTTDGSMGTITANDDDSVTASLSGGTDNDWDDGDAYVIAEPRFGDAYSEAENYQPVARTVSGYRLLEFTRNLSTRVYVPLTRAFPDTWWTLALELWKGSDNSNSQVAFEMDSSGVVIWRRSAAGVAAIEHGSGATAGVVDHPDGSAALRGIPTNDVDYYQAGTVLINGTPVAAAAVDVAVADDAIWIGGSSAGAGSNFFDGRLRTVKLFARAMSPIEIDFLFQTMAADGDDDSVQDRVTVALRIWTDETDDTGDRYSRVPSNQIAPQRFVVATVDGHARIQLAAAVNGKVVADSELGSKLFSLCWIETPGYQPLVSQDSGWSAVFDLTLKAEYEGHYCCMISREDGGGAIVHFDVEAAS